MKGISRTRLAALATLVALAAIVAGSAWLRWPGFTQGGFASHDVAGILYNAMVLEHGGLPYVDTLELKAPGCFYLARLFAGPEARDIASFQIAANAWALASLVCVAGLAWRLWGKLGAVAAAGLYALHDAHLDTMDANYVTWANLPQVAAFWMGIEASRAAPRWRSALWLGAGALAGFAALCKRPAGIVLLVLLAVVWLSTQTRGRERVRRSAREGGLVLMGFGLAHVPICMQYLAAGEFGALLDGYFMSKWGLRYVGARSVGVGEFVREWALSSAHFLGLPLLLSAFVVGVALGARLRPRQGSGLADESEGQGQALACVLVYLLLTLGAAAVGARFYKGYFVAVAAPACLLAAAPMGLLGRRCSVHALLRGVALLACSLLLLRAGLQLERTRVDRGRVHDAGGRAIAAHLEPRVEPEATIWVWGWHLWDVYPLTGRMSASPIYKSLGILSQPNDDTWRRGAQPLRFVDSPYAERLIADLEQARPAYIVLGSTVPHRDFEQLRQLLRRDYVRDRRPRIGRVQFWRLRRAPPPARPQ